MTGRKTIQATPAPPFSTKMMTLRALMGRDPADGRTLPPKERFQAALEEAGLDFKATALDCKPLSDTGGSGFLIRFLFLVIDRHSGEEEEYLVYGASGAADADGLHAAHQAAVREFLSLNFLAA